MLLSVVKRGCVIETNSTVLTLSRNRQYLVVKQQQLLQKTLQNFIYID